MAMVKAIASVVIILHVFTEDVVLSSWRVKVWIINLGLFECESVAAIFTVLFIVGCSFARFINGLLFSCRWILFKLNQG
jgi:hypothetical protein